MMLRELPPTAGLPLTLQDMTAAMTASRPREFERELASFLEVVDLDLFSSGTLCLSIAFETLREVTGRKRVILPAYTCPLVAIAAHDAGMEIVVCDTAKNSFELDCHKLEQLCDRSIAAIVPTDIAGLPADLSKIRSIARASGAYVIEDAAQALGARVHGRSLGHEADMTVFSMAVGKGISLFDGGVLVVVDDDIRSRMRTVAARKVGKKPFLNLLRQAQLAGLYFLYNPFALSFVYGQPLRSALASGDLLEAVGDHFDFEIPAYEFDEFRKRIGKSALTRLPEFVRGNRRRALERASRIESLSHLQVLSEAVGSEGSWPFLMILAENTEQRDEIMQKLWGSGLGVTRLFISELLGYDYLRKIVPSADTPNARSFASRSFSITNSHWLSDEDFAKIMDGLSCRLSLSPQICES